MPIIQFTCPSCGPFEQYRPVTSLAVPPCPTCYGPAERHWIAPGARANPDPVVVYRDPSGNYVFPGATDGLYAHTCESRGYTRVELKGWADVRRFEQEMNKRTRSDTEYRAERQSEAIERGEKLRRSDFFQKMSSMSPFGRAVARAAIEKNNAKPRPKGHDTGFHVECYSYDRGSRDDSRDPSGRRRKD